MGHIAQIPFAGRGFSGKYRILCIRPRHKMKGRRDFFLHFSAGRIPATSPSLICASSSQPPSQCCPWRTSSSSCARSILPASSLRASGTPSERAMRLRDDVASRRDQRQANQPSAGRRRRAVPGAQGVGMIASAGELWPLPPLALRGVGHQTGGIFLVRSQAHADSSTRPSPGDRRGRTRLAQARCRRRAPGCRRAQPAAGRCR